MQKAKKDRKKAGHEKPIITLESLIKKNLKKTHEKKRLSIQEKEQPPKLTNLRKERLFVIMRNAKPCNTPQSKALLKSYALERPYQVIFRRRTRETAKDLRMASPYVLYGYPSKNLIRELIEKRGCVHDRKDNKEKVLTNNQIVEDVFGEFGVICVEDLVQEVLRAGPNIDDILSFFVPLQVCNLKKATGISGAKFPGGNIKHGINEKIRLIV